MAAGLDQLGHGGPSSITIESLCVRLDLSKGSFYHHFDSRREYTKDLLEYWSEQNTAKFIAESEKGRNISAKLRRLAQLIVALSPTQEALIRAWALRDPEVMRVQERVDRIRLEYVIGLFMGKVHNRRAAERSARIVLSFFVGTQMLVPQPTSAELRNMYRALTRLWRI